MMRKVRSARCWGGCDDAALYRVGGRAGGAKPLPRCRRQSKRPIKTPKSMHRIVALKMLKPLFQAASRSSWRTACSTTTRAGPTRCVRDCVAGVVGLSSRKRLGDCLLGALGAQRWMKGAALRRRRARVDALASTRRRRSAGASAAGRRRCRRRRCRPGRPAPAALIRGAPPPHQRAIRSDHATPDSITITCPP